MASGDNDELQMLGTRSCTRQTWSTEEKGWIIDYIKSKGHGSLLLTHPSDLHDPALKNARKLQLVELYEQFTNSGMAKSAWTAKSVNNLVKNLKQSAVEMQAE